MAPPVNNNNNKNSSSSNNNNNTNNNKKKHGKQPNGQPQQRFCRTQDAIYLICFILVIQNLNFLIVKNDPFELYSSSSSTTNNIVQEKATTTTTTNNNNNKEQRKKSRQDSQNKKTGRGRPANSTSSTMSTIDPYTPALLTAANVQRRKGDRTMIHIVKSRFMQYQPELEALGWARYWQFKYFCLPAMVQQTTQDFIWFIYTDPHLRSDMLHAMVELLEPYPNYYLIKSLENKLWKGGQPEKLTNATIYTGNQEQLEVVMALREELPILETRLDADDALPAGYFEEIQQQAVPYFITQEEKVDWMYWCVNTTLEWTWLGNQGLDKEQRQYGVLGPSRSYSNFCPTPGMTVGYATNTSIESIYSCKHSELIKHLLTFDYDVCGVDRKGPDCYQIVDKFDYPAFRSRTPTSASMVITDYTEKKLKALVDMGYDTRWEALDQNFGITRSHARKVNDHLSRNILDIARDAIMGQCTKGHSCRDKAKEKLNHVLETYAKRGRRWR